jgi:hypothetical protein
LEFEVLDFFDTLGAISNGTFANKVITIDPLLRKYSTQTVFNYADYFKSGTSLNGNPLTNIASGYQNRFGKTMYDPQTDANPAGLQMGSLRMATSNSEEKKNAYVAQAPDSVANDIFIEKYLPNRVAQLGLANYMRIKITVPGDPQLVAGKTVNFDIFQIDPKVYSQGQSNVTREKDPFYSGKYLISAVRHIVKNNSYITILELCKESVGASYPPYNNTTPGIKQLSNGIQIL